jgi:transcriptional regulator with XRE-family HTH domain
MSNKEKFLKLVSAEDTKTIAGVKDRIKNRDMLQESQKIALKVLARLKDLGWSQKDLANQLNVSPQQVTKIVSGKENMTIDTQIKLQNILNIPILASFYENNLKPNKEIVVSVKETVVPVAKHVENIAVMNEPITEKYKLTKPVRKKRPLKR